jgi:hypothetical protein
VTPLPILQLCICQRQQQEPSRPRQLHIMCSALQLQLQSQLHWTPKHIQQLLTIAASNTRANNNFLQHSSCAVHKQKNLNACKLSQERLIQCSAQVQTVLHIRTATSRPVHMHVHRRPLDFTLVWLNLAMCSLAMCRYPQPECAVGSLADLTPNAPTNTSLAMA